MPNDVRPSRRVRALCAPTHPVVRTQATMQKCRSCKRLAHASCAAKDAATRTDTDKEQSGDLDLEMGPGAAGPGADQAPEKST